MPRHPDNLHLDPIWCNPRCDDIGDEGAKQFFLLGVSNAASRPELGQRLRDVTQLVTQVRRQFLRDTGAEDLLIAIFHPLKLLEFLLPTALQGTCDQAIVWIDPLVLAFCQSRFVAGPTHLILPMLNQTLMIRSLSGQRLVQQIQLCGSDAGFFQSQG